MSKHHEIYVIPSGIDKEVASLICSQLEKVPLEQSGTYESLDINLSVRNSKCGWINTDHWISGMMSHFINSANVSSFEYDLFYWTSKIQYTVYDGKGTGYGWHYDSTDSLYHKKHVRKLSISLCLSSRDDYEGGELQIIIPGSKMQTFKMDCGDVIVFPSDSAHRVRPLKSGKRISLVGWMGGPKFK